MPNLADKQEYIYISSELTQDVIWKSCRERWMTGTDGHRESQGNSYCQCDVKMWRFGKIFVQKYISKIFICIYYINKAIRIFNSAAVE